MTRQSSGRRRAALRCALPLAVALAATARDVFGQEVRWTGTISYSRGEYVFSEPTQTVSLYSGLNLTWGRFDVGGGLPVLIQNSQLVTLVGGTPLPTGGPDHGVVGQREPGQTVGTRGRGPGSGGMVGSESTVVYRDEFTATVGDPFFSAGARIYEGSGVLRSLQVRASTKPPLRDLDAGVGTGAWDFAAGAAAFAAVGRTYAFVDLSYWWYGDMPELELADGVSYGVGLSRSVLDSRGSVTISFLGAQAAIDPMDGPASLGLGFGYIPRLGRSFSAGLTVGLSESSPDFSVYAGWALTVG